MSTGTKGLWLWQDSNQRATTQKDQSKTALNSISSQQTCESGDVSSCNNSFQTPDVWGIFQATFCDQGWWWCVAPQRSAARPPAPSLFTASVASGLPAVVGLKGTARAKMADLGSLWASQTCCNLRWWRVEYNGKLIFILYCSDIRTSVTLSHVNWSVQAYASD